MAVVDDQAPFRAAARAVIGRTPGFEQVGEAGDGAQALAHRLAAARRTERGQRAVIGVNIGKSKITALEDAAEDYLGAAFRLERFGGADE